MILDGSTSSKTEMAMSMNTPYYTKNEAIKKRGKSCYPTFKFSNGECLHLLVIGKCGSGKSALINAMIGEELAYECPSIVCSSQQPNIEQHIKLFDGIEVILHETTGIYNPVFEGDDIVSEILKEGDAEFFDVVFFCCKMTDPIDRETIMFMDVLNKAFGDKIWKKVVFVLTFANQFMCLRSFRMHIGNEAKPEAVKRIVNSIRKQLVIATKLDLFHTIPIALAGDIEGNNLTLPTTDNWLYDMWKICSNICKDKSKSQIQRSNPKTRRVAKEALKGATMGALVGTALSPGMGTIVIGATGAVIGGVRAVYSNKIVHQHDNSGLTRGSKASSDTKVEGIECIHQCSFMDQRNDADSVIDKIDNVQHDVNCDASVHQSHETHDEIGSFADELLQRFSMVDMG